MTTTLTPYVCDLYIKKPTVDNPKTAWETLISPGVSENHIFITDITWTTVINSIPSAQITVESKDEIGDQQIKDMFPTAGRGTSHYYCEVKLRGYNTPLSNIKKDVTLFGGYIVGHSWTISPMGKSTVLHVLGEGFDIQNASIANAGMTGEVQGRIYQFGPLSAASENTAGAFQCMMAKLRNRINTDKHPKHYIPLFQEIWTSFFASLQDNIFKTKTDAISQAKRTAINNLDKILNPRGTLLWDKVKYQNIPDANFDSANFFYNVINMVCTTVFSGQNVSFWQLLQMLSTTYFHVISHLGKDMFTWPALPLGDPLVFRKNNINLNYVALKDITMFQLNDANFNDITRVLLMVNAYNISAQSRDSNYEFEGEQINVLYPPENDLETEQYENLAGSNILFFNANALLHMFFRSAREMLDRRTIADAKNLSVSTIDTEAANEQSTQKKNDKNAKPTSMSKDEYEALALKFAKYYYYEKKNQQRTCTISTRFMPNIIPGLPCYIESPYGAELNLICFPIQVSHQISASGNTASTSISATHVHYVGEYGDIKNPIFPDYQLLSAGQFLKENLDWL